MSQPAKTFKVAIIGGGVCGLACAIALHNAGISVEVFEAAAAFGEVGAGIGFGPNAVQALKYLDLFDAVLGKTKPGDYSSKGFLFYSGLGDHGLVYDYPAAPEDASISMHRAVFLEALVGLVDPDTTHFKKRCTSVTESLTNPGQLVVHFSDGTSHETDIVLGADGIRSAVRNYVVADGAEKVVFGNTVAYRGLIPHAALKTAGFEMQLAGRPACFVGPDKHIVVVPIKNGEIINVAAFSARYDIPMGAQGLPESAPWVGQVSREELQKEFDAWGPDVRTLLGCLPEKTLRWSVHVVHPSLESYSKGNVALLGDAAHGMLPHLGAGAGQGLEDALLLVRLLSHPDTNLGNLNRVLQVYSHVRKRRAQMVWDASKHAGSVYDFHGPSGTTAEGISADLKEQWKLVWGYDVNDDWEAGLSHLRSDNTFQEAPLG